MAENAIATIRLLAVSREPAVLRLLCSMGESNSWHVETATSGWDAMERVQSAVPPHALLLDLPHGDGDSLHILRWLRRLRPGLPVIVLGCPDDSVGKEAARLGAKEILVGPFNEQQLEFVVRRHLPLTGSGPADMASEDSERCGPGAFFVSASPIMQKLRAQAELLAQSDVPVLILGENGSGKDTVVRLIHKLSIRSGFKLRKVNCAAMPPDMLEAELFVNARPPSAGTRLNSPGTFEVGEKGTLFLDEITEMPDGMQSKLLQGLKNNEFPGPGTIGAIPADVRILAASSANIDRALAEKKLREDLYYRLSAFTVHVPPLRQRKDEIPILLRYSMHQLARHYGLPPREFSSVVLDACQHYSWPGNLKELESFVKRSLVAGDTEFTFNDLPSNLRGSTGPGYVASVSNQITPHPDARDAEQQHSGSKSLKSLVQNVKWEAERNAIATALQQTGWNRKAASRLLQISYRNLLYKIDQYHMSSSEPFPSPLPDRKFSFQGTTPGSDRKE